MILATVRMTIPPPKRSEVLRTLRFLTGEASIQPGCLSTRIYHDENEEAVFMVEEVWKSQDDLDRYLRSEDYRNVLLVIELAGEEPEIRFQTISDPAGIEVVERARGCKRDEGTPLV
jgi:quinol monooxygenase YgiN